MASMTSRAPLAPAPGHTERETLARPPEPRADDDLLECVRRGQAGGLEALYDRHHQVAMGVALRLLRDPQVAEDAVQDAFLAVWRRAGSYRVERGHVRNWLLSVVHHRCIDQLRKKHLAQPPAALDETQPDEAHSDVLEQVLTNIRQARVHAALAALPAEQRRALELAYLGGLSCQQIADHTSAPLGTVKGRLRLGLQRLRTLLDRE